MSSDIISDILSDILSDTLSGILSRIHSDILSDIILSDISSDISSHILSDILSDISSDNISAILSDISFDMISDISSDILFDILSDILSRGWGPARNTELVEVGTSRRPSHSSFFSHRPDTSKGWWSNHPDLIRKRQCTHAFQVKHLQQLNVNSPERKEMETFDSSTKSLLTWSRSGSANKAISSASLILWDALFERPRNKGSLRRSSSRSSLHELL